MSVKKGIKAKKRPKGRPSVYVSAKDMQEDIDSYFRKCKPKPLKDKKGKPLTTSNGVPIIELNPPTITGLALHLGFASRQSMYDYESRNEGMQCIIEFDL